MIGKPCALLVVLVSLVPLATHGLENDLDFITQDVTLDELLAPGEPRAYRQTTPVVFGYGRSNGPRTWPDTFPTCGGRRQSPIDIELDRADRSSEERRRLRFNNYDELPLQVFLTNVGTTVVVTFNYTATVRPSISGFVLPGEYMLQDIRFHWGRNENEGSEHLLEGRSFPLEMQVTHIKKEYGTLAVAKTKRDGLAIVAYFFRVRRDRNRILQRLINQFDNIPTPTSAPVSIRPFRLEELAPPFRRNFVSYSGSLTTPLCEQVVRWIVSLDPLRLNSDQLPPFRRLKNAAGGFLVRNFRPPQSRNRRELIYVR